MSEPFLGWRKAGGKAPTFPKPPPLYRVMLLGWETPERWLGAAALADWEPPAEHGWPGIVASETIASLFFSIAPPPEAVLWVCALGKNGEEKFMGLLFGRRVKAG